MTRSPSARQRLVFPLDCPTLDEADQWIETLQGEVGVFKVGLELFLRAGAQALRRVERSGTPCFLDLKLHDIPETIGRSLRAVQGLPFEYLTVHALGGREMLGRAVEALSGWPGTPPKLLAVTVLTSHDEASLAALGLPPSGPLSLRLAELAQSVGVDGVVCSPRELLAIRGQSPRLLTVVPGIRPPGSPKDDQSRTADPEDAMRSGAELLVVGRPIRNSASPVEAARGIVAAMARGLQSL